MATEVLKDMIQGTDRNKNVKLDQVFINLKQQCVEIWLVDALQSPVRCLAIIPLDAVGKVETRKL